MPLETNPEPFSSGGRLLQLGLSLEPRRVGGGHGVVALTFDAMDLRRSTAGSTLMWRDPIRSALDGLEAAESPLARINALRPIRSLMETRLRLEARSGACAPLNEFELSGSQTGVLDLPSALRDGGLYSLVGVEPRQTEGAFDHPEALRQLDAMGRALSAFAELLDIEPFALVTRLDGLSEPPAQSLSDRLARPAQPDLDTLSHQRWLLARELWELERSAASAPRAPRGAFL